MKKLRRKIVLGVFLSATAVFALTVLIVGVGLNIQVARRADATTNLIAKFNGKLPEILNEPQENRQLFEGGYFGQETLYRLRYFTVTYDSSGAHADLSYIASIKEDEAIDMANSVIKRGNKVGYTGDFRFRVSDNGAHVVFLDNSDEITYLEQLELLLLLVAFAFDALITLVFAFLSKRIVNPFAENARMQKQFITDASHELKTPLAIISANAEVLAYKDGENEWINNITSQVARVSELVNELLTLNRLEEVEEITDLTTVNLSEMLNTVADSFAEVFRSKNVSITRSIEPDVSVNGNTAQLERLISVLTENASKYVSENGEVILTLKKGTRFTRLTIFNTCEIDENADLSHLFDRFYRPDSSRTSRTGGHGVGLSIAKRIVTLHNGTIDAEPSANGMTFIVKLSNKLKAKNR